MQLLSLVCNSLGVSHQQLAILLGTTRSSVSKAITGIRQLPYEPTMALVQLHAVINHLIPAPLFEPADSAISTDLTTHINNCRHKLSSLQKDLQAMYGRYRQNTCLVQTLDVYSATVTITLTARQKNWLEELKYQGEKKLATCSLSQQKQLEIQIALLIKEIELYELELNKNVR
jgi:hypothetical protein